MAEKKNARKNYMSWKAGDVEIILPNGKKFQPAKKKPAKATGKKGK